MNYKFNLKYFQFFKFESVLCMYFLSNNYLPMHIVFHKAIDCLRLFSIYEEITQYLSLQLYNNYMAIECMDDSHTMICKCKVLSNYFNEYDCQEETVVHIPMKSLEKVIKCIHKDEIVKMICNSDNIEFILTDQSSKSKMTLPLVDIDSESFDIPSDIEYDSIARFQSRSLMNHIHKLKQLGGNTIEINTNEEYLTLKSNGEIVQTDISIMGGNTPTLESIKNKDPLPEMVFRKKGYFSHEFSLESIKLFMKPHTWISEMQVCMKQDFPILFSYNTCQISLQYYLAPKIEDM